MIRTLVLTSSKNFKWMSMQEIIPYICDSWKSLESENHKVEIIDIDEKDIFKRMKEVMQVDNIVCTCFTVEIVRVLSTFRKKFGLEFKTFFYVHGQATIAMWPFLKWGGLDFLTTNDYLVVSCNRDIDCLKLAFDEAKIIKHPFLLKPSYEISYEKTDSNFIYIGRVSEQKNLHSLILAVSLIAKDMRHKGAKLKVVGGGDSLGTPVAGILPIDYVGILKRLITALGIEDLVEIVGHIDRSTFPEFLSKQNATLISASLHSDENFGMVPFQYLSAGGRAILSDWGGYADFKNNFDKVTLFPVVQSGQGHFIRIERIADAMRSAMKGHESNSIKKNDDSFSEKAVLQQLKKCLEVPFEPSYSVVRPTQFSQDILNYREEFYENTKSDDRNHGSQIFKDFADGNLHTFTRIYGAKQDSEDISKEIDFKDMKISPFVELSDKEIVICDPHRGMKILKRLGENLVSVENFFGESLNLSNSELNELYKLGYVTLLP